MPGKLGALHQMSKVRQYKYLQLVVVLVTLTTALLTLNAKQAGCTWGGLQGMPKVAGQGMPACAGGPGPGRRRGGRTGRLRGQLRAGVRRPAAAGEQGPDALAHNGARC